MGRDEATDAASAGEVDGVAGLLEHLEHPHVRVALGAACPERHAELRPRQVPRDPGQIGVGQGKIPLPRAVADDALEELERPGPARLARLVADEDHLEVAALRGLGDPAEPLHLVGVPGQGDHAIQLVEHHGEVLGLEVARNQDGGAL